MKMALLFYGNFLNMIEIPDYGNLYLIEEFRSNVDCGGFIPYDGAGYYATKTHMSREHSVWSSNKEIPSWATHVIWFNR